MLAIALWRGTCFPIFPGGVVSARGDHLSAGCDLSATTIAERLHVSQRIITILEGESPW